MIHHADNCPVKPKCTCGFTKAKDLAESKQKKVKAYGK